MERIKEYNREIRWLEAQEILIWALDTFGCKNIALASSFSIEDQILTNMFVKANPTCRIFTLDTGRNFQETYDVWQRSVEFWNISYEVGIPDGDELAQLVAKNGPNLFYSSVELRKICCAVRKIHPLRKILSTVDAWIVGLRSEQSITRTGLSPVEWDSVNGIYRISPLYDWSEIQTISYTKDNFIPISELYEKGYRSIGCAPCTRVTSSGEDIRAGRWWWEEPEHKECGLHNRPNFLKSQNL